MDDTNRCCSYCNNTMEPVSSKTSEQLDIIPAQVQVIRHVRQIHACRTCQGKPHTAELPAQPIPKTMASPGTLAHIAVSKYVDASPLYRQEQQLKRIEIDLPRSTLARWMIQAGLLVQPLINVMRDAMLAYDILSIDETRLQVLKELGTSPQSLSYLWVQRGGPPDHSILLYDYDPSRASSVPVNLLGSFKGYLQSGSYDGYNAVCINNDLIQLGKAMNYADKQWSKLTTYRLDGRLSIDNNLTENLIRPFAIGRKNFLLCDSAVGAKTSANLYSLIETARCRIRHRAVYAERGTMPNDTQLIC